MLKGGDGEYGRLARGGSHLGLLLLALGTGCAFLPAVGLLGGFLPSAPGKAVAAAKGA